MAFYNISPQLSKILRDNGVDAMIVHNHADGKFYMVAQGFDNVTGRPLPELRKEISAKQADEMSRWLDMGAGSTNKKAYATARSILREYNLPLNYSVARNAMGPVNMGQASHPANWFGRPPVGYGMPRQEFGKLYTNYGRPYGRPMPFFHRQPFGYFGGAATFPGDRVSPGMMRTFDIRGGRLRPTTGVYWLDEKQYQSEQSMPDKLDVSVRPEKPKAAERPEPGMAKPYSEQITADVYFTKDKYLDVLASHGIIIDEARKTLTIKSSANKLDYRYVLTDEQLAKLTNNSLKKPGGVSLQERLDVINSHPVFKQDFSSGITQEMLESRDIVSISLTPEAKTRLEGKFEQYEQYERQQQRLEEAKSAARSEYMAQEGRIRRDPNAISGREIGDIIAGHGWYNGNAHGREAVVAEIRVDPPKDSYFINVNTDKGLLSFNVDKSVYDRYMNNEGERDKIIRFLTDEYRGQKDVTENLSISLDSSRIEPGKDNTVRLIVNDGQNMETIDIPFSKEVIDTYFSEKDSNLTDQEMADKTLAMVKNEMNLIVQTPELNTELKSWFEEKGLAVEYDKLMMFIPKETDKDILIDGEKANILKVEASELKGKSHTMSAMINGQMVTHEISAKDYEKFMRYDDEHRLKLFDSIFGEVSIEPHDRNHVVEGRPDDVFLTNDGRGYVTREELEIMRAKSNDVDGQALRDLNYKKGFYREGAHGREVNVESIKVEPDPMKEGQYKMTAVINGESITHDISQKQYDKFLAVDDYQRLKLFSKVFNEVDMKIRPEYKPNVGAMLMAGLVGATEVMHAVADIGRGIAGPLPPPMPMNRLPLERPEIYESRMERPMTRSVSAHDLAAANFEAEQSTQNQGENISQNQGMGRGV